MHYSDLPMLRMDAATGLPVLRARPGGGLLVRAGRAVGRMAWGAATWAGRAIDAGVYVVAPGWAQRRTLARQACNQLRGAYAAADVNRLNVAGKIVGTRDPDSELQGKQARIRNLARDQVRNNAVARNLKSTHKNNTVGDADVGQGFTIDPAVVDENGKPNKKVNRALKRLWEENRDRLEYTGRWGFADMLAINDCELTEAGEVLNVLHTRPAPGSPIPFSVELLEADRLPTSNESYTAPGWGGEITLADEHGMPIINPKTGKPVKHMLKHGIEYDENKQQAAFHILNDHPGQELLAGSVYQTRRVKAPDVIHYFKPERAEQTRGVSWFVVILSVLSDMYDLITWELLAAKAQACFGLHFGGAAAPNMGIPNGTSNPPRDGNGNTVSQIQPGMLTVGDQPAEFYQGTRPGNTFLPFFMALQRLCGAGFGIGYSATSKDYGQGAYSALRQEDNEDGREYQTGQGLHARHFCKRVWPRFVKACAEAGLAPFSLRDYMKNPEALSRCAVNVPGRKHINPLQEVTAEAVALANGMKDLNEVVNASGKEPADRIADLAEQKKQAEAAGVLLSWAVGKPKPGINAGAALKAGGADQADQAAADQADQAGETEGQADGVPAGDVQKNALNGAQVQALQEIVQSVVDGKLPEAAALEMLLVAFPDMEKTQAQKILAAAAAFTPEPEPEPQPVGVAENA